MIKSTDCLIIQSWMRTKLKLKGNELLVFAVIYSYSQNKEQIFSGSRRYIAEWAGIDIRSVGRVLKSLLEKGLLCMIANHEQAKNLVINRKGQGTKCEWCGYKTFALQEHHYPIPKSKGGTQTVLICPNCHCEYHLILNSKVKLKQ